MHYNLNKCIATVGMKQ